MDMMQLSFLALALAAQNPASGPAGEQWVELARPEGRVVQLDLNSIHVVRGQIRSARTRVTLDQPDASGRGRTEYVQEVDCQARSMALTGYANYRPDGSLINQGSAPNSERQWTPFAPGSQGAATMDRVCR